MVGSKLDFKKKIMLHFLFLLVRKCISIFLKVKRFLKIILGFDPSKFSLFVIIAIFESPRYLKRNANVPIGRWMQKYRYENNRSSLLYLFKNEHLFCRIEIRWYHTHTHAWTHTHTHTHTSLSLYIYILLRPGFRWGLRLLARNENNKRNI